MPSINTSHHLDSNEVPKLSITTHYVLNKDGSETEKSNFHVFKIETIQSEANYFFKSDDQLQEFMKSDFTTMFELINIETQND
jgi:hypothetical protein